MTPDDTAGQTEAPSPQSPYRSVDKRCREWEKEDPERSALEAVRQRPHACDLSDDELCQRLRDDLHGPCGIYSWQQTLVEDWNDLEGEWYAPYAERGLLEARQRYDETRGEVVERWVRGIVRSRHGTVIPNEERPF